MVTFIPADSPRGRAKGDRLVYTRLQAPLVSGAIAPASTTLYKPLVVIYPYIIEYIRIKTFTNGY